MRENLVNKVGECGQDNLIARLFPLAMTTAVMIVAGAGKLERGTVLSRKEDGTCEVMAVLPPMSWPTLWTLPAPRPRPPLPTVAGTSIPMR